MNGKISVRERILNTASRLFYLQGFNNTGINQIIAEADIAIGSLYKHFKSKNDLLASYLEQEEAIYFLNLDAYNKNEKHPVKALIKLIDYRIKLQEDSNCSGCPFIKINAEVGRQDKMVEKLVVVHKQKQRDYLKSIVSAMEDIQMEKEIL